MRISKLFRPRSLAVLLLLLVLTTTAYAFAAANTVDESGAGEGSDVISGYTITNITYDLNTDGDPSSIDTVVFDISSTSGNANTPTEVQVKLTSSGSTWYSCTVAAGTATCDLTDGTGNGQVSTLSADELSVAAAQ